MTVSELGRRMDAAEFAEWVELEGLDPLPDPYWCAALVAHVLEALWTKRPRSIEEFLPRAAARAAAGRKRMGFADLAAMVGGLVAAARGRKAEGGGGG